MCFDATTVPWRLMIIKVTSSSIAVASHYDLYVLVPVSQISRSQRQCSQADRRKFREMSDGQRTSECTYERL